MYDPLAGPLGRPVVTGDRTGGDENIYSALVDAGFTTHARPGAITHVASQARTHARMHVRMTLTDTGTTAQWHHAP